MKRASKDPASGFDPQRCWRAVLARDKQWDAAFVYAVRSTGIYCRPSCPSRRPGRGQVLFFALPEAAEQRGFRACQRCHPRRAARDPNAELVQRVCRYIETNLEGPLTLAALAAQVRIGPHHLQRTFQRIMGITPRQYADARRLGLLKKRLREGKDVTTALYAAGYGSSSRLYERAPAQLGMTPATYRRGGSGTRIGYTIVDSPLGRLLVAATPRGICRVALGDKDAPLEAMLASEYPQAEIQRDLNGLARSVRAIVEHLRGKQPDLDLPLDVQGTAFEWRVWNALRAIPRGETRSYGEIAKALGRPGAARAVGRACWSNHVALVIPCHRVVRGNGALGGYRWGIERKRTLLEQERQAAQPGAGQEKAVREK